MQELKLVTKMKKLFDSFFSKGMIKIAAPRVACEVVDAAIQLLGGAGLSQDTYLAFAYAHARILRLADGPDEVHLMSVAKSEL